MNRVLSVQTKCVQFHGGMIDKFIGDAMMAIFNAPLDLIDHEDSAISCALDICDEIEFLNVELAKENKPPVAIGIGINTGEAIIGNMGSDTRFDYSPLNGAVVTTSNANFGVWARFAYALNAQTEYICVLDDDTVPGSKWLENCVNTIKQTEGLLGAIGVVFKDHDYINYDRHGWAAPNEKTVPVDIVGHSWFFKREWLGEFWREAPIPESRICGEDMHFSYTLQKYLNLNTYVPPHQVNNKSL